MVRSKFIGAILGSALGDAIGKCVEDLPEEEVYKFYGGKIKGFVEPHPQSPAVGFSPYEVSDETTISILLLESIIEKKGIDPYHFYQKLLSWREDEKSHRYPDPALLTAIDLLSSGISLEQAGLVSSSVEGILRAVVVGLFHFYNPYLASEGARLVCLMTHRSPEVYDASALLSAFISYLVSEEYELEDVRQRLALLEELKKFLKYPKHRVWVDKVAELLMENAPLERAILTLGNSTYTLEALSLSLYIFLSRIYEPMEAFWTAINSYGKFGGDTDSIGYLVGAYVGAYWGVEVFPPELLENLENSNYYISLAQKLYEMVEEKIGGI